MEERWTLRSSERRRRSRGREQRRSANRRSATGCSTRCAHRRGHLDAGPQGSSSGAGDIGIRDDVGECSGARENTSEAAAYVESGQEGEPARNGSIDRGAQSSGGGAQGGARGAIAGTSGLCDRRSGRRRRRGRRRVEAGGEVEDLGDVVGEPQESHDAQGLLSGREAQMAKELRSAPAQ